jgi:glycerophosphoryl diester phosphodiesterase
VQVPALRPVPGPGDPRDLPRVPGGPRGRGNRTPGVFGDGPALIGHRGMGRGVVQGHRENTLGSFTAAARLGMRWVEADVRRTADDVLVVAHDAAYPDGTRLAEVAADEGDRRGTLRLRTLLDRLPAGVGVNLDLKSSMEDSVRPQGRTTAGLLGPVAGAEAARRRVLVSSFDPAALGQLRASAPAVALGWLTWHSFPVDAAVAGCAHLDVDVLCLQVGSLRQGPGPVDPAAVARALAFVHGSGRRLLVWCPEPGSARLLLDAGADAVVVDEVPDALDALGRTA